MPKTGDRNLVGHSPQTSRSPSSRPGRWQRDHRPEVDLRMARGVSSPQHSCHVGHLSGDPLSHSCRRRKFSPFENEEHHHGAGEEGGADPRSLPAPRCWSTCHSEPGTHAVQGLDPSAVNPARDSPL